MKGEKKNEAGDTEKVHGAIGERYGGRQRKREIHISEKQHLELHKRFERSAKQQQKHFWSQHIFRLSLTNIHCSIRTFYL